jgi:3-hydroxyisobutyrate dehydrogenase-like beta-hydroxyacid dehydrogenase
MNASTMQPVVGFIGLGDQGLPWRPPSPKRATLACLGASTRLPRCAGDVAHVRHDDTKDLTAECDVVALCVSTDEDVLQIVTGGLLDEIRPGLGFS